MALTSEQIAVVNSDSVYHALLIRIIITSSNIVRLTNHYTNLTLSEGDFGTVTYDRDSENNYQLQRPIQQPTQPHHVYGSVS